MANDSKPMNRRNFFKLAAASIAGFFLPRKMFATGGVVEFAGPRHGGKTPQQKFDNLPRCHSQIWVYCDPGTPADSIKVFLKDNPNIVFDVIQKHSKKP
jgi:hypothetical protein